jgi:hypothetical protein
MRHSFIHITKFTLPKQDKTFTDVAFNQQFLFSESTAQTLNYFYVIRSSGWEAADLVTSPDPLYRGLNEEFEFISFLIPAIT